MRAALPLATLLLAALLPGGPALAAGPVRVEVVADNSIVLHPDELTLNAGKKTSIRIKGNQHLVALAIDARALRGMLVESAVLVCRRDRETIEGVTLATIQTPWDETRSNALTAGIPGVEGWGVASARFPAVTGGNSFSLVGRAKSEVRDGAYHWAVSPDLLHAIAIGAAYGISIHEWSADYSRNPTIRSREDREHAPHLLVTFGGREPKPEPARDLRLEETGDAESLRLRLRAPRHGFAYEIAVNGRPLPRFDVPFVRPGEEQAVPIRDIPLGRPGGPLRVAVTTLDRLGRRSKTTSVSGRTPKPSDLPTAAVSGMWPRAKGGENGFVAIPLLDKYDLEGKPVGDLPETWRTRNTVFDGKAVRLRAARGEVVGFQALIRGKGEVRLGVTLGGLRVDAWRALYVPAGDRRIPDPLVPLGPFELAPDRDAALAFDVFVPFDEKRRRIEGTLTISDGREVPIALEVRDFALPRRASFLCEMNSYGMPDDVATFYRLQEIAYDHRAHVNILHYSHRTAAPGARKCNLDLRLPGGRRMDEGRYNAIEPGDREAFWDDFAAAFGPYLSGRCFAKGHRGAVPAPGFYLTFHESWPLNVRAHFDGNPDAYEAFRGSPEYARTFVAILRDFARRAKREGWTETGFQVYLNNKGSLADPERAPWILDEPASFFDFRALAFYADLVAEAKGDACPVPIRYRIDISRPQFDRGELRGKADLWVVNREAFRNYPRLLADRPEEIWTYGSPNEVGASNREIAAWVIESFRGGARGVVPWQTIDRTGKALRAADRLGLFILAGRADGKPVVHHSLRLKAFRRAQQDVEYLVLLREKLGLSPAQMRDFIDRWADSRDLREATAAALTE